MAHKKMEPARSQHGMTLVEVMVVIAVIGILATLAIPKFAHFQAKARQSEAKTNLNHIYSLEQAYHAENEVYARVRRIGTNNCERPNPIGFKISDCSKVRYDYRVNNISAGSFNGSAENRNANRRINPACTSMNDRWTIDQDKILKLAVDASNC